MLEGTHKWLNEFLDAAYGRPAVIPRAKKPKYDFYVRGEYVLDYKDRHLYRAEFDFNPYGTVDTWGKYLKEATKNPVLILLLPIAASALWIYEIENDTYEL